MSGIVLALALIGQNQADATERLENRWWRVEVSAAGITRLECDPSGSGRYEEQKLVSLGFGSHRVGPETRVSRVGESVVISGLDAVDVRTLATSDAHQPDQLAEGATLGQSFTIAEGTFARVEVHLPTWNTSDSSAMLTLRREGPLGDVIATRRMESIADNSWQAIECPAQGAGTYYVEVSEPRGVVGWWSTAAEGFAGGRAFADGKPIEGRDRDVRVGCEVPVGRAAVTVSLQRSKLTVSSRFTPRAGQGPRAFPLELVVPWDNTGYDVSAMSVPFFRFFSDALRYMPTEQLKRWAERDGWYELSLNGAHWIEADGTGNHDLRFDGDGIALNWHLRGKETLLRFQPQPRQDGADSVNEVTLELLPRDDALPDDWPRFVLPGATGTEEANRFLWERAFSYPPMWGPGAWLEWIAIARLWQPGPHIDQIRDMLETYPITPEGYVHTWGGMCVGWPFPDPTKYDTRHFDTNARFILACWRYAAWTGDRAFLERQTERIRRAMDYQLTVLKGEDGLIVTASKDATGRHQTLGNNYWDILPFGHLDAYANAVWYGSLEAMAQIEEMMPAGAAALTPQSLSPGRGEPERPSLRRFAPTQGERGEGGVGTSRSPTYYRHLARKVHATYDSTFWSEPAGRYIGCVDVDGKPHDYGFTFVNLEALAYGLGDAEKARRIYHWMETEPTSTGKADTYTAFEFAPRATTIHNPEWRPDNGKIEDVPEEPWWHFGWLGTPFGDQCQDGGAILYTSYFDLMARLRLVGADNAWQRWEAVLARWRMPDHLCGGPPLLRGEHPQQVNPGATGTDIPFPESGLVPCWLLNGVIGAQATARGLDITPCLPRGMPWAEVRNVGYHGLTLDIRVTSSSVTVTSRTTGQEATWQTAVAPGSSVVFTVPPSAEWERR
jgi:hypothetical protein